MSTPASAFWTPKREERLVALLAGGQTFTQIATALRTTKGTVAGRVRKLKEAGVIDAKPKAAPAPQRAVRRQKPSAPPVAPREIVPAAPETPVVAVEPDPPPTGPVTLMALRFPVSQCRWIDGDTAGTATVYCGAEVQEASSYCPEHASRCYRQRAAAAESEVAA